MADDSKEDKRGSFKRAIDEVKNANEERSEDERFEQETGLPRGYRKPLEKIEAEEKKAGNYPFTPEEIAAAERAGTVGSPSGLQSAEDFNQRLNDKLGKGFTGGQGGKKGLLARIPGSSRLKKRLAAATILAGGSVTATIVLSTLLLPLKITHIIENIQTHFQATTRQALEKEARNLEDGYLRQVVRSVLAGQCKTTIDSTCRVTINGKGPIGRLYNSWRESRLELSLAKNYNIVIGRNSLGQYVMNIDGIDVMNDSELRQVAFGDRAIWDINPAKVSAAHRADILRRFEEAIRERNPIMRVFLRFKMARIFKKYSLPRCEIRCNPFDKYIYKVKDKLLVAKAKLMAETLSAVDDGYGLIFKCMMQGSCDTALKKVAAGDVQPPTAFNEDLWKDLSAIKAANPEEFDKLVKKYNAAETDDFTKLFVKAAIKNLAERIMGEEAAAKAADIGVKAVDPITWILLAFQLAQLEQLGSHLNDDFRHMVYAVNSTAAMMQYQQLASVSAETKSGKIDSTILGSFATAISSNYSGSSTDKVDATGSCLYKLLIDSKENPNALPGLPTCPNYKCNNGQTVNVAAGKSRCPEEYFPREVIFFKALSDSIHIFPWYDFIDHFAAKIGDFINAILGPITDAAFNVFCNGPGNIPPGPGSCPDTMKKTNEWIQENFPKLEQWLIQVLGLPLVTKDMSGARAVDVAMGGADQLNYLSGLQLGGGKLPDQKVADMQNRQIAEEKANFEAQPLFARLFNTDSPYSFISRVADATPTDLPTVANGLLADIANPFSKIAGVFSSAFSGSRAFAAIGPQPDFFGVPQIGVALDDPVLNIPKNANPQTYLQNYLDKNCKNYSYGDNHGNLADVTDPTQIDGVLNEISAAWMNKETDANHVDNASGLLVPARANGCIFIGAVVEQLGGTTKDFKKYIPTDEQNPDPTPPTQTGQQPGP